MFDTREFVTALISMQRSSEIPPADDLFGWLNGSWDLDCHTAH